MPKNIFISAQEKVNAIIYLEVEEEKKRIAKNVFTDNKPLNKIEYENILTKLNALQRLQNRVCQALMGNSTIHHDA